MSVSRRGGALLTLWQDPKREHRLIPILQFVHTQVYRYCFGKAADGLERSVEGEDECQSFPCRPRMMLIGAQIC